MRDFWKENLGLKLLSLAIAMLLWLLVVNVSKPEVSDSKTVKLEVLNEDAFASDNKIWELDGRDTVQITYRVRTDQQRNISASDFRAYIDLEDYSITGSVPVYVEVLNDKSSLIEDVTARPQVVKVVIEDIQQKKFDLQAKTVGSKAADGYTVSDIIISPESVYAIGPESEIGKISSIGIEVDIEGLSASKDGVATPVFYDANGNRIELDSRVSVSKEEIAYTVTVHKIKSVNLLAHIAGSPAAGYQYEGTTVSPASIQLSAVESVIDKLNVLNLPQINITGATDSITQNVDVSELLPAGVELAEPGSEVVVTVRIVKLPETETSSSSEAEMDETTAAEDEEMMGTTGSTEDTDTEQETAVAETTSTDDDSAG